MKPDAIYEFGVEGYAMSHADCFLAQFSDVPCAGRMERSHLIRQQTIRRELRKRVDAPDLRDELLWDPRVWRLACELHHGQLDHSRTLRIPAGAIPAETWVYADEHGLRWWLERTYPVQAAAWPSRTRTRPQVTTVPLDYRP